MSPDPSPLPDVSPYVDLLNRFIERRIAAPEFEASFLHMMNTEHRILGQPIYSVLQALFEDADAYVERPELRSGAGDLDDEQTTCVRTLDTTRIEGPWTTRAVIP